MSKIIGNPTTTPMAIPDYDQNNEKKADYIKNRPFYEDDNGNVVKKLDEKFIPDSIARTEDVERIVGIANTELESILNGGVD